MRIALKVDCDTALGTRDGLPRLLDLFERAGVRATFFFSLGPDHSGRALKRIFTRPGFLRKMIRSRAPSLYPVRTMLSGTLLPAPVIGEMCRREILAVGEAGHETGVHAWDHVGWHDGLDTWSAQRIAGEYAALHDAFARIFGRRARASACPGWTVNDAYLAVRESRELDYTSDTRNGDPFLPAFGSQVSKVPEVPSTLPTLDEMLGDPAVPTLEALLDFFAGAPTIEAVTVHTIHTEVEGGAYRGWFERLISKWKERGAEFVTLADVTREAVRRGALPVRRIGRIVLPGRGGSVASGVREP